MELVVVSNWLGGLINDTGILGGGVVGDAGNACPARHSQSHYELDGNGVCPARKKIAHEMGSSLIEKSLRRLIL